MHVSSSNVNSVFEFNSKYAFIKFINNAIANRFRNKLMKSNLLRYFTSSIIKRNKTINNEELKNNEKYIAIIIKYKSLLIFKLLSDKIKKINKIWRSKKC